MPCTFALQLAPELKTAEGWTDALRKCATEVKAISDFLVSIGRKEIKSHPDFVNVQDALGEVSTPPTLSDNPELDGIVKTTVSTYSFINSRLFSILPPQLQPTSFFFIVGDPSDSGDCGDIA